MSETQRVYEGRVVPESVGPMRLTGLDGFQALRQIVEAARECFLVHEVESTKRRRLDVYERVEVRRIQAAEAVLKGYFQQVFAERAALTEALFAQLDTAMENGDSQAVHEVLRGIVDIAQSSPIAELGDLSLVRQALDDPDHDWDL
jgi:O-glycosyl hydrolase